MHLESKMSPDYINTLLYFFMDPSRTQINGSCCIAAFLPKIKRQYTSRDKVFTVNLKGRNMSNNTADCIHGGVTNRTKQNSSSLVFFWPRNSLCRCIVVPSVQWRQNGWRVVNRWEFNFNGGNTKPVVVFWEEIWSSVCGAKSLHC